MKCKHALDYEVCLVCRDEAYHRAGKELPDDRLMISEALQDLRNIRLKESQ